MAEPYGNHGYDTPGAGPEDDHYVTYRYGIRVESDARGPQEISVPGNRSTPSDAQDARRRAEQAADEHRSALRQLGMKDAVVPWIQRVVRTTTVRFDDHTDLDPFT